MAKSQFQIELLERPGVSLDDAALAELVSELRMVAATCFDDAPSYQCLSGNREELKRCVIAVARDRQGRLRAFCSSLLLDVEGVGAVLHLGLTCVEPGVRGRALPRKLLVKLIARYYFRRVFPRRMWVSNVACVLSSLGNVALGFDGVYPSPFGPARPTATHQKIASAISDNYRQAIYIDQDAQFDTDTFVFRASVRDTMFQKDRDDSRYLHRSSVLNDYYGDLMSFDNGDEVCQVGYITAVSMLRYAVRRKTVRQVHAPSAAEHAAGA
ncbi:MAG: hypothetical protein H6707_14930 [Deltaproteobacteria bacterium]|nr:hypothetical protein [Deltaproteobacteria bacterium]